MGSEHQLTPKDCINKASRWLASLQHQANPDDPDSASDGGWGEYKGADVNVLNTAESVLSLAECESFGTGSTVFKHGIDYLIRNQRENGAWCRDVKEGDHLRVIPDTVRTSFALRALSLMASEDAIAARMQGAEWLLDEARDSKGGGWGYSAGHGGRIFPTCLALQALLDCREDFQQKQPLKRLNDGIESGIEFLKQHKIEDGSVSDHPLLAGAHTLHTHATLKMAQRHEIGGIDDLLSETRRWLRNIDNLPRVLRWGNETISIGKDTANEKPSNDPANYTYTHVTPSIYLREFGDELKISDRFAHEALLALRNNMNEDTCGFTGNRPVSWSTAKCMMGLKKVTHIESFPENAPIETGKPSYRHVALIALIISLGLGTWLSYEGTLDGAAVSLIFLFTIAVLLIYGFISEKTFLHSLMARFGNN